MSFFICPIGSHLKEQVGAWASKDTVEGLWVAAPFPRGQCGMVRAGRYLTDPVIPR
jgi:hypothetical protein